MCIFSTSEDRNERQRRRWADASPGKPAKLYRVSRRMRRASRRRQDHFYAICGQLLISDEVKAAKRAAL
jgi:hypothetical protein